MNRTVWLAILVAALGAVGIGLVQPGLAANVHKVHERDDVYLLPPPAQLRAMTLGYRATAADMLWAKLLVESGTQWQEHRASTNLTQYVDGIIGVEPDYQNIYLFVDTIVLFVPGGAGEKEAYAVRKYLERGTRERPYDPEVWLHYGQYIAFLAPSFLKDEREIEAWRRDGALALMHAVDLGADADRSITASTLLSKAGEHEANVKAMERNYALTDNPETRRQILGKIKQLKGSFESQIAIDAVEREHRTRWPMLPRGAALLIGPERPAASCAGPASYRRPECPRDWTEFIAQGR